MTSLPQNYELLDTFRAFLSESGLSKVSIKNYVSDVRKFLEFASQHLTINDNICRTANDYTLPTPESISRFVSALQDSQIPHSTINRYLASLRRYSVFLKLKFNIDLDVISTGAGRSGEIAFKKGSLHAGRDDRESAITSLFLKSLQNEDLSHSTVKNYKSDLNHFLSWTANSSDLSPSLHLSRGGSEGEVATDLSKILTSDTIEKYQDHLRIEQTS